MQEYNDNTMDRWLESAKDLYDKVDFNTDALFNEPAPDPWVAFMIGGILSAMGFVYWVFRVKRIKQEMMDAHGAEFKGTLMIRGMISAFIDSDETLYTIIKMGSQSFLFLGGLQLDYKVTFTAMLIYFAIESCSDTLRILMGFQAADDITNVLTTSSGMKSKLRNKADLQPTNVYEDLSRDRFIVIMVFVTQVILISFVVADIYESETTSCKDGSQDCPVVGTFGSWSFYVLGIFMACVFLLGPKTAFGQSEQNPAFWLKLLVFGKQTSNHHETKCTWFDPHKDCLMSRRLHPGDYRVWMRFFMSFLINGVGFHILVHALPIQVASQSSFTGVVFRAVGMMYLVDLDDTPGYRLTIVTDDEEEEEEDDENDKVEDDEEMKQEQDPQIAASQKFHHEDHHQEMDMKAEAEKILQEARSKLDQLAAMQGVDSVPYEKQKTEGALAMAAAVPQQRSRGAQNGEPIGEMDIGGAEGDGADGADGNEGGGGGE